MNISRIFIARPIATSLLMIGLLLAGLLAYRMLPLSALPEVDYPTIQVVTHYPGASPAVITSSITAPLEKQLGQMPGLTQMSSSSANGTSIITLQFDLDLSLDIAEQQVQAAINAASNLLPQDLPAPPVYNKVNPADTPILTLALTSQTMPLYDVHMFADTRLAQKISQMNGVGMVTLSGGQRPAVRIQVNPTRLAAYGLNIEDVRKAIGEANVNQPKGTIDGPARAYTIDANDQMLTIAQYQYLLIAYRNNAAVRLSDVADVIKGPENVKLAAWANETPAILVNIQRQPQSNVIEVVNNIKNRLPELTNTLPKGIDIDILSDRTRTIRSAIKDVQFELILAVILVVCVIFLFLGNIRATIIPSVAVPLSIIGSFAVMYLAGFSLNNLSLMALTISTGFVVDDAIVMIENIERHLKTTVNPYLAALEGAKQIGFTILSLTLSLIAVLIPLLFMSDVVGRLFKEFALTLSITIIISAIVSLTLTPMMCAYILRHQVNTQSSRIQAFIDHVYRVTLHYYSILLNKVLKHQQATICVAVVTLMATIVLYILVPKGFLPAQDTGLILGFSEAPQSISFPEMSKRQRTLTDMILKDPAVNKVSSFIGVDGNNTTLNSGQIHIYLKQANSRQDNLFTVMNRLQKNLATLEGISLYMQPAQDLTIETKISRTQYQFLIEDTSYQTLNMWTPLLLEALKKLPELANVSDDAQNNGQQLMITIDRPTASRLGITMADIDNTLYSTFGQRIISTVFSQSHQERVILEAQPHFQLGPDALKHVYVTGNNNVQVPLAAMATISQHSTPLVLNHVNQFPTHTFSFNLAKGYSLEEAMSAINTASEKIHLPKSMRIHFEGAAKAFSAMLDNQLFLFFASIIAVYIVLGVLYESYIHPITILSTLPSAGLGALLGLFLWGHELDMIGVIGIVLLIGIVKKNAIMMIDFALEAERKNNLCPTEAIYQACLLRFRPIMMTTMAAILGAIPLLISQGVGNELRQPLGITIIGGLVVSQILTLFTTPVIYLAFDRLAKKMRGETRIDPQKEHTLPGETT